VCVACIYLIKDIHFYFNLLSTQAINWIQRLRRVEYLNTDMVLLQLKSARAMLNDLLVRALNEPEKYSFCSPLKIKKNHGSVYNESRLIYVVMLFSRILRGHGDCL